MILFPKTSCVTPSRDSKVAMKLLIPHRTIVNSLLPVTRVANPLLLRDNRKTHDSDSPVPSNLFSRLPNQVVQRRLATSVAGSAARHSYVPPAQDLDRNITEEEKRDYDLKIAQDKDRPIRTPWMREGSDQPPVSRDPSASVMTQGTHARTLPNRHILRLIHVVANLRVDQANS